MTTIVNIVAGTKQDRQGDILTKEAIDSIVESVNGDRAVPVTINHDPFCMPLGKVVEAWIETREDDHVVVARIYYDDALYRETHRISGTELVYLAFQDHPKPFVKKFENRLQKQTQTSVSVDLMNFDNRQHYTEFAEDVSYIDDTIICDANYSRKSFEPEPLIQIVLSNLEVREIAAVVGIWIIVRAEKFIRYTIDETLKKTGDELSDKLSTKIKDILRAYKGRRPKDNRPIVTKIILRGDTELILLTQIESDTEFQEIDLKDLKAEMEKYNDLLQEADSVTFSRNENGNWEFQYLMTKSGKVIGTSRCYDRTIELSNAITGFSIAGSRVQRDSQENYQIE